MPFKRQEREERHARGHWGAQERFEIIAAIASLLVVVAATFVIILVDTWFGIALVIAACALYFALSIRSIGGSRRRVAAQLTAFEQEKRNQDR